MRGRIRAYAAWLMVLLAMAQVVMMPRAARADQPSLRSASSPVIGVTYVPAYGEQGAIQGQVFCEDGSDIDSSGYRIAMFIQLSDGGTYWPKPTYDQPYCVCQEGGFFTGRFITGGDDMYAKRIHLYLVTNSYASGQLSDAQAQALDYVTIERDENGGILVSPKRQVPDSDDGASAMPVVLPVSKDRIAVDVDFHTDGSGPGSSLSEELIRAQLDALSHFADCIRIYGAGGEEAKAYAIAHEMGFSVVGTAYLCVDASKDQAEMDALIEHCNNGYVQVACVGNETLLDNGNEKNFADALSIGPWCYKSSTPILLTNKEGKLTDAQVKAVRAIGGVKRLIIVGGKAVVSDDVIGQLGVSGEAVERLAGSDRYKTSRIIADWELAHGMTMAKVSVATGANFPDALAGAALCGKNNSVLVLAKGTGSVGLSFIKAHRAGIRTGYALGGESAVSAGLLSYLKGLTK